MPEIRTVNTTRYITPLREGGSLPALIEADDDFKYVLKFKGAGHGPRMLISELLGSEIARYLGLKVPEIVFVNLDEDFGRTEADEEIQDLLKFSQGLNLGLHYLSGSTTYDPSANQIGEDLASRIVWLDAFITNVDRTFRNTNMLMWNKELWLIDHGASFYFHHSWYGWEEHATSNFEQIKDHVLLKQASRLHEIDEEFRAKLSGEILNKIVDLLPYEWLETHDEPEYKEEMKSVYKDFLKIRLNHSSNFVNTAIDVRKSLI
ncbi:HipA family kinase [Vaginella massiliensis]|uniref:HipA family kinase n=1 Tax=Vaginella massiliensis TaxID=1816680 RepID=UPI00083914B2|nr:HipA family kinase [Vaginella massiliensis]